jgi:hypothetical protein
MPEPALSRRRWARSLVIVALALVAAEAAYLAAARWLLRSSSLPERLNRRPERLRLTWSTASSPWPGLVRARDVELRVQTGTVQWWLHAEEAWGMIDLAALPRRVLRFTTLRARGVEIRLRRRPRSSEEAAARQRLVADIPGLAFTQRDPPREGPAPAPRRRPWSLRFDGLELTGVDAVWIDEYEVRGRLAARADLAVRLGRSSALPRVRAQIAEGMVRVGGRTVATGLEGSLSGKIREFDHRATRGWGVLPRVDASGRLDGRIVEADFLNAYVSAAPWLALEGGEGTFTGRLALVAGRFARGSALEISSTALGATLLDYEARGGGRLRWSVETVGREERASLAAELAEYSLRRRGDEEPQLRGASLRLEGSSRDLDFDGRLASLEVTVEAPDAEVPDLRYYNRYLPEAAGVRIAAGTGRVTARFRGAWPAGSGEAELDLEAQALEARIGDLGLRGHATVAARLRSENLEERVFDVAGTTVDLQDVALEGTEDEPSAPDWWARLALRRGTLRPREAVYLEAEAQARLRDSRPLLAIFAARRPLPAWARPVLTVENVGATGEVRLGKDLFELDRFAVVGEGLTLQARLRMAGGGRRGALLAEWRALALGIELRGSERQLRLVGARKWFEEQPPLP